MDSFKEGSRVDFKIHDCDSEIRVKDNTEFGIAAKVPHTEWGVLPPSFSSGGSPHDLHDLGLGHSFIDLLKLALGPFNGIWS